MRIALSSTGITTSKPGVFSRYAATHGACCMTHASGSTSSSSVTSASITEFFPAAAATYRLLSMTAPPLLAAAEWNEDESRATKLARGLGGLGWGGAGQYRR